jgi:hypothetical protein
MADYFVEKQTIEMNGRYPLASALAYLPQTNGEILILPLVTQIYVPLPVSILAFAGTNTEVQLWVSSEDIVCLQQPFSRYLAYALSVYSIRYLVRA